MPCRVSGRQRTYCHPHLGVHVVVHSIAQKMRPHVPFLTTMCGYTNEGTEWKGVDMTMSAVWNEHSYGKRGWTTEKRVRNILAPYLNVDVWPVEREDNEIGPYEPFQGLGSVAATRLLGVLPIANLADRQNFAPTCESLLRAAVNHPGKVELFGYAIGPSRPDERVTIEGLVYYDHLDYKVNDFHTNTCQCEELWQEVVLKLGLQSALEAPDEIARVHPTWNPDKEGWWIWWD